MSYQDRIDAALAIVKEHSEAIGKEQPGFVCPEKFISCIKAIGGTSEERLSSLMWEDILTCLPSDPVKPSILSDPVKPSILAKAIAKIFRKDAKTDPTLTDEKRPVSGKKAERMTVRDLVENFDPEDYSNAVGARLAEVSRGEAFIVYANGRVVNIETTLKLLLEVKKGYKGRTDIDVANGVKKVYRLGELPENYADENPLYRGRPLRPDGTCDQTGRSWEGIDLAIRQFVRVAMDTGELHVTHEQAHNIIDMVVDVSFPSAVLSNLRKRYRQAAIKFDELQNTGDLPTLKIELAGGSEGKNPFADGKQVVWAQSPASMNAYVYHANVEHEKWKKKFGGTSTGDIARRP